MQLRLPDEDRERFGCDEWLDYDPTTVTVEDAEAVEEAGGEWTSRRAQFWLALRRAGHEVAWGDLANVNLVKVRSREGKAVEDSASDESPTSPTSA